MFQHEDDALMAFGQDHELDTALLEEVRGRLGPLGLIDWQMSEVEEENWNAQWESDYPEVTVSQAIRVRAPFHAEEVDRAFDHTIVIQPRMAFGTGHHGTTRGILAEMVNMDWMGLKVLDMGCGSGVLGIYAAMRGAAEVLLVDIDPWSVRNTRENIALNGYQEGAEIEVREGGANALDGRDEARFDVVIANINRNILLNDMAAYATAMKPTSRLMLSGFMQPDVNPLISCAAACGLEHAGLREEEEWRVLTLRR